MNKLEEYILRYQGIHDGVDPYVSGGRQHINNTVIGKGKILFDGSQLGRKLPPFIQTVIDNKKRAITLLDYGCGKALHVHRQLKEHGDLTLLGRFQGMIQCYYCYDPAVQIYSVKPPVHMVFDLVCCADVMEHVPEEFVAQVLQEIAAYTKDDGTAMFTISGNLAKKSFSDGENLHATVRSVEWWVEQLKMAFGQKSFLMFYKDETKEEEPIQLRYQNSPNSSLWDFEGQEVRAGGYLCQVELA